MKMKKTRVMFLCTGNSCRSQMAQGWARELASNILEVKSAGIEAHGKDERAIQVMAEVGIDISQQQSIRINGEMLEWSDVVVTLCDNAEEQCPIISPQTLRIHLPLADPSKLRFPEENLMSEFRVTREKVKRRVERVISQLK